MKITYDFSGVDECPCCCLTLGVDFLPLFFWATSGSHRRGGMTKSDGHLMKGGDG